MKMIPLTRGKFTIVDDDDFEWLSKWKWQLSISKWGAYAYRSKMENRQNNYFFMHREIVNYHGGNLEDLYVDHINHDGLDNRRRNLRVATNSQNQMNRKLGENKSGYKGVTYYRNGKWRASSKQNGRHIHLGYFDSKEEAAVAYNKFASNNFGEFAKLNEIGSFYG